MSDPDVAPVPEGLLPEDSSGPWPFGPVFFIRQLAGLIRSECPDPVERLPAVELHLADGCRLDLCHIVGVAPRWIALSVYERESGGADPHAMRTELLPYEMVTRITVRSSRHEHARLGFDPGRPPAQWGREAPVSGDPISSGFT